MRKHYRFTLQSQIILKGISMSENQSNLSPKALIVAALYIAGRPVPAEKLAKIAGIKQQDIDRIIKEIQRDFASIGLPFQILKLAGNRFSFQLMPEYVPKVKQLAPGSLFSEAELKTLSLIAIKQPVKQSEIARIRGSQAYQHIEKFIERGFVRDKMEGRTRILVTTPMFSDYFGLPYDMQKLKAKLKRLAKKTKTYESTLSQSQNQASTNLTENLGSENES